MAAGADRNLADPRQPLGPQDAGAVARTRPAKRASSSAPSTTRSPEVRLRLGPYPASPPLACCARLHSRYLRPMPPKPTFVLTPTELRRCAIALRLLAEKTRQEGALAECLEGPSAEKDGEKRNGSGPREPQVSPLSPLSPAAALPEPHTRPAKRLTSAALQPCAKARRPPPCHGQPLVRWVRRVDPSTGTCA
jgi:hypothetical protein